VTPARARRREGQKALRARALRVMDALDGLYSDADCTLEFRNPLELLISTQLAAQCTDERVNAVTASLYEKYRTAGDFARADAAELEREIRPTGFFRNKARNIIACCRMIESEFGGEVPGDMESLLRLPGVGRKTANLVLGDAFGVPGIVVDTHAGRLARRLGFTEEQDPGKVERALLGIIPPARQTKICHQLVLHGRARCRARKPDCGACALSGDCPKAGCG
jgi:endonuclease-3